jgi:hypothetical protein
MFYMSFLMRYQIIAVTAQSCLGLTTEGSENAK